MAPHAVSDMWYLSSTAAVSNQDMVFLHTSSHMTLLGRSTSGNLRKVFYENQRESSSRAMGGFQRESFDGETRDISVLWEKAYDVLE